MLIKLAIKFKVFNKQMDVVLNEKNKIDFDAFKRLRHKQKVLMTMENNPNGQTPVFRNI